LLLTHSITSLNTYTVQVQHQVQVLQYKSHIIPETDAFQFSRRHTYDSLMPVTGFHRQQFPSSAHMPHHHLTTSKMAADITVSRWHKIYFVVSIIFKLLVSSDFSGDCV